MSAIASRPPSLRASVQDSPDTTFEAHWVLWRQGTTTMRALSTVSSVVTQP